MVEGLRRLSTGMTKSHCLDMEVSNAGDATLSDNQGQQRLWRPTNKPQHTCSQPPPIWHSSGMRPLTALSHPGVHRAAKYNVSFQRRCSDERSQVNCLGYNRNLPVRPSHIPWQLGLTSPTRYF